MWQTFSGAKKVASMHAATVTRPTREQALKSILGSVGAADVLVSTTGYTSRELFELRETLGQSHSADFLTVGSMGHSLAIAQGIARARPDRTVWCLDGDGAALMHLGSLASSRGLPNLRHIVLNNGVHDSVGGQPTAASQLAGTAESGGGVPSGFDFTAVAAAAGYKTYGSVATAADLTAALSRMESSGSAAGFLEVGLALGTRKDLGRPTVSTHACKEAFMGFLRMHGGFSAGGGRFRGGADAHGATGDRPARGSHPPSGAHGTSTSRVFQTETGDPLLLTPGPLTTSATVKSAMLHDYGSRDPAFIALTARVREQILDVLEGDPSTTHEQFTCVPLQGSGTFAVEAMLMQFLPRDSDATLLVLANGAYGKRMATICEQHRRPYALVEMPEAAPVDIEGLAAVLEQHPEASHVAVVHCETVRDSAMFTLGISQHMARSAHAPSYTQEFLCSRPEFERAIDQTTGVVNDIEAIAEVVHASGRRLLIDAMSAFGVLPLHSSTPFDAVAASSNKGLQGSPGLAFCIARKGALEECVNGTQTRAPCAALAFLQGWIQAGVPLRGARLNPVLHPSWQGAWQRRQPRARSARSVARL